MKRKEVLKLTPIELDKKVKIQGTQYDRKRKLTNRQIKKIKRALAKGVSEKKLAKKYKVDPRTIRYNSNLEYKFYIQTYQALNFGDHTGEDKYTIYDRSLYKRHLVSRRKINVRGII